MNTNLKDLPPRKINYESIRRELTAAHSAVSELRGALSTLKNPDLLVSPLQKKEAISSSAIEGTYATLEEILKYDAQEFKPIDGNPKIEDIKEILNYDKATSLALQELKIKPIGENLIKKVHHTLLDSVRGENKNRGNFRKTEVYIGDPRKGVENAFYVPPTFLEVPRLMKNWEEYLNKKTEDDLLIRIAVAHYQFEAIHPFMDGNGRIGRLLIPLFLYHEGVLPHPILYISGYFEEHKKEYQLLLREVDQNENWEEWIRFFLVSVASQANKTRETAKEIQNLYETLKKDVAQLKSVFGINLLDEIFISPVISFSKIKDKLGCKSNQTVYNTINKFIKKKILSPFGKSERNKLFVFSALVEILKQEN